MKRSKPLSRRSALRPSGRLKRKGKSRFPKRRDRKFLAWVREQDCLIGGRVVRVWTKPGMGTVHFCWGRIEAAHVKTRGSGGDDRVNTIALCALAHRQQHDFGIRTFEDHWGVDLKAEALKLWKRYERETVQ